MTITPKAELAHPELATAYFSAVCFQAGVGAKPDRTQEAIDSVQASLDALGEHIGYDEESRMAIAEVVQAAVVQQQILSIISDVLDRLHLEHAADAATGE